MSETKRNQGILLKYNVTRTDGKDAPGQKHAHCFCFVLDVDHDPFALPALTAYAAACASEYPLLADDLRIWVKNRTQPVRADETGE